jgi:lipopolysaccharide transport system ATP-binding protein
MADIAIRATGLSKRYRLGTRERYSTLRDSLARAARSRLRRLSRPADPWTAGEAEGDWLWALRDVSFDVRQGEVIGVIGRNGAGKSTLLKILSRITEPTDGMAEIHGRVGSLLEVGIGFHPELTGRENIYLSGAIIGMRRREIARQFDEIVAFADLERFVDTPVKRYSSGMYVRLAFAVAAHLQSDILLVDEVLAVGDAAFQKKCLGRLGDVARDGRTVLLVSHNLVTIERLCGSALLLEHGRVARRGSAAEVVQEYLARSTAVSPSGLSGDSTRRRGSGEIRFVDVEIASSGGPVLRSGDGAIVRLRYECRSPVARPVFSVAILTLERVLLFAVHSSDLGVEIPQLDGQGTVELEIASLNLMPNRYVLDVAVGDGMAPHRYDHVTDAREFDVETADVYGSGRLGSAGWSLVYFDCKWRLEPGP